MDEAKGPNPHFEGLHEGESDELRALRLALVKECRELRESLDAVSDALDYLHGMTPQHAAEVRKDAGRYRKLREARSLLKLYVYEDAADPCSGNWQYKPSPEAVDTFADGLGAA